MNWPLVGMAPAVMGMGAESVPTVLGSVTGAHENLFGVLVSSTMNTLRRTDSAWGDTLNEHATIEGVHDRTSPTCMGHGGTAERSTGVQRGHASVAHLKYRLVPTTKDVADMERSRSPTVHVFVPVTAVVSQRNCNAEVWRGGEEVGGGENERALDLNLKTVTWHDEFAC